MSRRRFVRQMTAAGGLAFLGGCGGSAVSTPQPKLRRIGYLSGNSSSSVLPTIELYRQTLRELGYAEDRDFVIDVRISEGQADPLPAMAAELLALPVDDGLVVLTSVVPPAHIADFAAEKRLPAIYGSLDVAGAGSLMSLGVNNPALFRKAAGLVDKILKGARPSDLPIEHPTQIDFVVNIAAAKRLGLAIPDSVLRQATAVVR